MKRNTSTEGSVPCFYGSSSLLALGIKTFSSSYLMLFHFILVQTLSLHCLSDQNNSVFENRKQELCTCVRCFPVPAQETTRSPRRHVHPHPHKSPVPVLESLWLDKQCRNHKMFSQCDQNVTFCRRCWQVLGPLVNI